MRLLPVFVLVGVWLAVAADLPPLVYAQTAAANVLVIDGGTLIDGTGGPPVRDVAGKALLLVSASIVVFGLLVERAGVGLAVAALVLTSASASRHSRPLATLLLAAALGTFCVLVFVKGLGLPFPVLGIWLKG